MKRKVKFFGQRENVGFALNFGDQQIQVIKSWVTEGLSNSGKWEVIDKRENCSLVKGSRYSHAFSIEKQQQQKSYKCIRLRQIAPDWYSNNDR